MKIKIVLASLLINAISALGQGYPLWSSFKLVSVNTSTAGVTGSVTNFPTLVRLSSPADDDIFAEALAGGADIRFAKLDGTQLPYEIETWDAAAKTASIWVLLDAIAGSDITDFKMYWGRAGQTSASNPATVFKTDMFSAAWHLKEAEKAGTGTVGYYLDATTNNNDADDNISSTNREGMVGFGHDFASITNDYTYLTEASRYLPTATSPFTFSSWIKPTTIDTNTSGVPNRILSFGKIPQALQL